MALQDQRTPAGQRRVAAQLAAASRLWFATELTDACRARRHYLNTHPGASEQDAEAFRVRTLRELQDGTLALEAPKEMALQGMLRTWLDFAGQLHDMHWKLLHTREGDLVIGDRPMTMHDPTPRFPFSGNGLHSSSAAYTLVPLGSSLCLRLDRTGTRLEQRSVARQVERINLRSYGWAERFVYGADRRLLEELHAIATRHPERAPGPRAEPQVICEEADPNDPTVGAEHPPGYPRGLWYTPPDAPPVFMAYRLQHMDDRRTVGIDSSYFQLPADAA